MQIAKLQYLNSCITADGAAIRELAGPLVLLGCCMPASSDTDTVITDR